MKDIETFLAQMYITQYWTRPHTPKDKAFNERFHRALYRDASKGMDYHYEPLNVKGLSEITDAWLDKYHFHRPHKALSFPPKLEYPFQLWRVCPIHSEYGQRVDKQA
jgi:transposase InsO family protein